MSEKKEKQENTIFGIRAILEALESGKSVDKLFIQKKSEGYLMGQLLKVATEKNIAVNYVPFQKLDQLSKYQNHQGAVAKMACIEFENLEPLVEKVLAQKDISLFLILDGITDVRNFGAIVRSAVCAGVDAVIIAQSSSAPVGAEAAKTSAGGIFHMPIAKIAHIKDALILFKSMGVQIVAATEKAEKLVYDCNLKKPTALIMGSEEKGIHPSVLKMSDEKVGLPIKGAVASLNVSVATGALLYEVLRQRRK